jgi:DNA repair photolyase
MAAWHGVRVTLSITTLDPQLTRIMEPRTSVPARRLEAIRGLSEAGIPVGVMVAPIVPAINDHQLLEVLAAARAAGAANAGFQILRLPFGVKDLFMQWLEQHFPDRKDKVIHRIEALRGGPGKLNCSEFGQRLRGEGIFAEQIADMFRIGCQRLGLNQTKSPPLSTAHFRRPMERGDQLELFSG